MVDYPALRNRAARKGWILPLFALAAWILPVPAFGVVSTDLLPRNGDEQLLLPRPEGDGDSVGTGTTPSRDSATAAVKSASGGPMLAGPVDLAETRLAVLQVRFTSVWDGTPAPADRRFLAVDVEYTNLRSSMGYQLNLAEAVVLVEDGQYIYPPDPLTARMTPNLADSHTFPADAPDSGTLVFQVPPDTGDLSLIHFTQFGTLKLDLTPEIPVPLVSPVMTPVESEPFKVEIYGIEYDVTLPDLPDRYVVIDVAVTLVHDNPMAFTIFDAANLTELRNKSNSRQRPAPVWDQLERPLRRAKLWAGQPMRGQVAFSEMKDPSALWFHVKGARAPISFSVKDTIAAQSGQRPASGGAEITQEKADDPSTISTTTNGESISAISTDTSKKEGSETQPQVAEITKKTDEDTLNRDGAVARTGVALSSWAENVAPPEYWFLFDPRTKQSQPRVADKWGFTAAPAGHYVLKLKLSGQSEVIYAPIEVRSGETSSVAVDTGVELSGRTPQSVSPEQWILRDAKTNEELSKVWRRWGIAAVPAGRYVLSIALPGQSEVIYAPVEVRQGEISSFAVDTGFELLGRTPEDVAPEQWILRDAETDKELTKVWRRWGFAAVPPGHYSLTMDLPDQTELEYARFEVLQGQVKRIRLDTGFELVAGSASDVTPKRWQIYDAESGQLISQFYRGWGRVWLPPGRYVLGFDSDQLRSGKSDAIELNRGDIAEVTLAQFGLGAAPHMRAIRPDETLGGFNIALAELGGKIESATSPGEGRAASADALIDGLTYVRDGRRCRRICGWASAEKSPFPHEFVISFYKQRSALISAVAFDPVASETIAIQDLLPRHVEIWTSMTNPNAGFEKIAAAQMQPSLEEQLIEFPPTTARYVKLRILSNHGGRKTSLGEVKIMEAASGASILDDAPRDLARPENGGVIVWFTSQAENYPAAQLLWQGDWRWTGTWKSAPGPYGPESYLPQDVVFAFRGDREALIDRLVVDSTGLDLDPQSPYGAPALARKISIFVSSKTPLDGFEKAGEFILEPEARRQAFPIGRRARFVKLRILETQGASTGKDAYIVTFGKIKLIEGNAPGYTSVLKGLVAVPEVYKSDAITPEDETGLLVEREPNDTPRQANPLEIRRWTRGTIDPLGEEDHFHIPVSGDGPAILTMGLKGRPNIRASMTLTDPDGRTLYRFDPGRTSVRETEVSLQVQPGDLSLNVTQPINSIVLLWDTSGSMKGRLKDLRTAILSYFDQLQPTERLNLIRFDKKPEVLLPGFTSDRTRLLAAVDGKFALGTGTALYDAIDTGISLLASARGNRALVVMTDGEDDGSSELDHAGLWKLLSETGVRIYTIGLGREMKLYSRKIGSSGERFLGHMALATNGHAYFADKSEDLKGLYQQIADDLRSISPYYLNPELSRKPGRLSVVSRGDVIAEIPPRFELIFDASGSMKGKLSENETKIAAAKSVMKTIIDTLPDGSEVALRVYGHRIEEYQPGDCEDSQLLFSFQKINKATLNKVVNEVEARSGTTPLSYSLVKAAQDLADTPGHKIIVLVTDGEEYCGAVPHEVAEKLAALGMKLRVDVVGFALANPAVKQEMIETVKASGGSFHDAQNPESLTRSIRQALAPSYEVLDSAGNRVGGGVVGRGPIELPQGIYTVRIQAGDPPIEFRNVRIIQDKATEIRLKKQGQEIGRELAGPAAMDEEGWAAEIASQPAQDATPASAGVEPAPNLQAALAKMEGDVLAAIVNRPRQGNRRTTASVVYDANVLKAQKQLAALGFAPGGVDGVWGKNTARAVREFQNWYPRGGLNPNGKLDTATRQALAQAVAERMTYDSRTVSPAAVSPGPAQITVEGKPVLLDTARLRFNDRSIRLYGVEGVSGDLAVQMRRFVREQGGWVRCLQQAKAAYVCRTRGGIDLAEAALLNGAARAGPGAPKVYLRREQTAREERRGIWAQ